MKFLTFTVTLTLKITTQFSYQTLQLMIKFGCKKISSSVDMVETAIYDYMSPHCDLDLENNKPIFLRNTMA